jgi:hypothetical protein
MGVIETETRPLTEAERRLLPQSPTLPVRWSAGIGPGLAVAVIALLLGLFGLGMAGWTSAPAVRTVLALAVLAGVGAYGSLVARTRVLGKRPTGWDDLQEGTARVTRFDATDAVAVEESEDEGLSYFVALDDGRVLFLSGQYLYEPVERGAFPARRFEVVRTALAGTVLSVTSLGPALAPGFTRSPFTDAEFRSANLPEDGAILPGPLATWRESLARHGQTPAG